MRRDFLKTAKQYGSHYPGEFERPYKNFRHSEIIVHRLGDHLYPEHGNSDGELSSRFELELYDFYHNGIKVILGIYSGVVGNGQYHVGAQQWAIIPFRGPTSTACRIRVLNTLW